MAAAIGECSGEVGQHGKWTDLMIPFIRRWTNMHAVIIYNTTRRGLAHGSACGARGSYLCVLRPLGFSPTTSPRVTSTEKARVQRAAEHSKHATRTGMVQGAGRVFVHLSASAPCWVSECASGSYIYIYTLALASSVARDSIRERLLTLDVPCLCLRTFLGNEVLCIRHRDPRPQRSCPSCVWSGVRYIRRVKTKLVSKRDQAAGRTAASMSKGPSAALEVEVFIILFLISSYFLFLFHFTKTNTGSCGYFFARIGKKNPLLGMWEYLTWVAVFDEDTTGESTQWHIAHPFRVRLCFCFHRISTAHIMLIDLCRSPCVTVVKGCIGIFSCTTLLVLFFIYASCCISP